MSETDDTRRAGASAETRHQVGISVGGTKSMTKEEMLLEVQLEVEAHLAKIEKLYERWNLHFDRLTLIARATENDNKIIVLTTEDDAGLEKACALAIVHQRMTITSH